jgi:hypothetical protein
VLEEKVVDLAYRAGHEILDGQDAAIEPARAVGHGREDVAERRQRHGIGSGEEGDGRVLGEGAMLAREADAGSGRWACHGPEV